MSSTLEIYREFTPVGQDGVDCNVHCGIDGIPKETGDAYSHPSASEYQVSVSGLVYVCMADGAPALPGKRPLSPSDCRACIFHTDQAKSRRQSLGL